MTPQPTRPCATTEDLVLLIDGELTENRAAAVREHLTGCAACQGEADALRALVSDLAHPIEPRPGAVERLFARLDEPPPAVSWRGWRSLAAAAAVAAAGLAVVVGPRWMGHAGPREGDGMVARGGPAERSIARDVGLTVYRGQGAVGAVATGDEVGPDAAYSMGYRNLGDARSAYAMVFAQDAAHEVHWVAPAWTDASQDPASIALAHADHDVAPSEAVVLDHPAPGALHVFTLVTPRPLRVSEVEALARSPLDAAALRAKWPDAAVEEKVVHVVAGTGR